MLRTTHQRPPAAFRARPRLEALEDRCLLSGNVLQTNIVSDLPGVAQLQDPHLVNPWGIAESSGSPFWISDNGAGVSTLYSVPGAGTPAPSINSLVVSIPAPGAPLGSDGTPTGTVFNGDGGATGGFKLKGVLTNPNGTTSAIFLFVTEDGTIVGWNPNVNPQGFDPTKAGTYGIIAVDNSGSGAVYKGMTFAKSATPIFTGDAASTSVIYVANFHSGKIEVYDRNFGAVTLSAGAFSDPDLPKGYAPFNVEVLGGKVYVTYAKQDADKADDVAGPGHGFVDVFNLDGTPGLPGGTERLASRGTLNSPWGLALAPSSFGDLAGDLLVGNFGDGRINVFNPTTGAFLGQLKDPDGETIQIDGLWALKVGNGGNGGATDTVYFTAGLFDETHGLFGSLKGVAAGTPEGQAEQQMVTAFLDVFQLAVQQLNADLAGGASRADIRQDIKAVEAAFRDFVRAEVRFAVDAIADAGGHGAGHLGDLHDLDDLFEALGRGGRGRD
jgi:uncharacterized protein (TIGR03118 family)